MSNEPPAGSGERFVRSFGLPKLTLPQLYATRRLLLGHLKDWVIKISTQIPKGADHFGIYPNRDSLGEMGEGATLSLFSEFAWHGIEA